MNIWTDFHVFAFIAMALWAIGLILFYAGKKNRSILLPAHLFSISGIIIILIYIFLLWINLERPPLKTIGETRLWYVLFLSVTGYLFFLRWKYLWFLTYCLTMASLFLVINYLNPETYDKTLMPALQSPWFIPHVIVYILAYALLAASCLVALKGLYLEYFRKFRQEIINMADNLVYLGFGFLTFGLLFGALWAKEAWGHYWTWDPKETWALLTWLVYLVYIHSRHFNPVKIKSPLWTLSLAYVILLICWLGMKYLPVALNSVHVYNN